MIYVRALTYQNFKKIRVCSKNDQIWSYIMTYKCIPIDEKCFFPSSMKQEMPKYKLAAKK